MRDLKIGPRSYGRLAAAVSTSVEALEQRTLYSASPKITFSPDAHSPNALAANPSLQYEPAGVTVNTKNDDSLSIYYQPPTYTLQNLQGFLSKARSGSRLATARAFLAAHAGELHLTPLDLSGAIVTSQYTDADTGTTHIYLRQVVKGVPISNANLGIHLNEAGRVLSVNSSFIPDALGQISGAATKAISASQAVWRAAGKLGIEIKKGVSAEQNGATWTLNADDVSLDDIPATKQYMATASGIQPVWSLVARLPDGSKSWYSLAVSTADGSMLFANDWTDHATYNAYPLPTKAPNDGGRQLIVDPADPVASPFGWHDNNGVAGAEYTDTRGNNVFAQDDTNADNTGGTRPDGGAGLNFDFPLDLSQSPSSQLNATTTNLFYLVNTLHDIHYRYGFDEASGNFQVLNYSGAGTGDDPVLADDQDGGGYNNANFSTPPEGTSPRMQMYNWFAGAAGLSDGALDATIVVHEFGHGISTRLTGGPDNSDSLVTYQSGAMGEGWSDWWALMLTMKSGDSASAGYGIGSYEYGQSINGKGVRRQPYSFDKTIDPITFDAYNGVYDNQEVHSAGEIWCSALWDMSWLLIQKYGFNPSVASGYSGSAGAGNKLALQLVMDALKLQPTNPSMTQARDAILLADENLTGGANQSEIWSAFARRGLGLSAYDGGNSAARAVRQAFDIPEYLTSDSYVVSKDPTYTAIKPLSSVALKFNEPMDKTSFSIASDVLSFTSPSAVDLKPAISGFTWSPDGKTLTIAFAEQTSPGNYSLLLSPNILSADNGHALDQNRNGIAGESADQYSTTFAYQPFAGPDVAGYKAGAWTYEDLHLTPGGAGVTSILANNDDENANIDLGSNVFRFYSTTYTGLSRLYVNPNGEITLGSPASLSNDYAHSDLTTSPSQPAILPMWHDWFTNVDANDQVLYRFDDVNGDGTKDRLVIEWHALRDTNSAAPGAVTFQAILQLNSGSQPGSIVFNYPDLDGGNFTTSNGNNSTVGIKGTGSTRVLVSRDSVDNPFLGSGKAVRISTDWTAPTASASFVYLTQQAAKVTFSENVSASLTASDFVLINQTTGQTIPTANLALAPFDTLTNTATLIFPGYPNGVLPDGVYSLSLPAASTTDLAGNSLGANVNANFFVLGGDATHDGKVDTADFNALAGAFNQGGQNFATGDFNYDGKTNLLDFNVLASNFGKQLAGLPGDLPESGLVVSSLSTTTVKANAPASLFSNTALEPDASFFGFDSIL